MSEKISLDSSELNSTILMATLSDMPNIIHYIIAWSIMMQMVTY